MQQCQNKGKCFQHMKKKHFINEDTNLLIPYKTENVKFKKKYIQYLKKQL